MGIKKQFLKSKPVCKVSFSVSTEDAIGAKSIQILGEFNNWNQSSVSMKELKSGAFSQTINLEQDKEYQFRYLIDGEKWINDIDADAKTINIFNDMNDIVSTFK